MHPMALEMDKSEIPYGRKLLSKPPIRQNKFPAKISGHTVSCNTALYAQGLWFAAAKVREARKTWPQLRLNRGPMLEWACVK